MQYTVCVCMCVCVYTHICNICIYTQMVPGKELRTLC